ncbi:hypothetical protein [Nannocystis pusilla]|uniref:hypothetical protein n=1 Tax=Nannocystis pusilla TaxID=889268 RepID=UPI003DA426B9
MKIRLMPLATSAGASPHSPVDHTSGSLASGKDLIPSLGSIRSVTNINRSPTRIGQP